jgi:hypothetical protein
MLSFRLIKNRVELDRQYAQHYTANIIQKTRQLVKTESDLSSNFSSKSIKSSSVGGNKLKKYTRLGRAQINKDNMRTSRVIYNSGKGYYIRDVKGIYTPVHKKNVTFA